MTATFEQLQKIDQIIEEYLKADTLYELAHWLFVHTGLPTEKYISDDQIELINNTIREFWIVGALSLEQRVDIPRLCRNRQRLKPIFYFHLLNDIALSAYEEVVDLYNDFPSVENAEVVEQTLSEVSQMKGYLTPNNREFILGTFTDMLCDLLQNYPVSEDNGTTTLDVQICDIINGKNWINRDLPKDHRIFGLSKTKVVVCR